MKNLNILTIMIISMFVLSPCSGGDNIIQVQGEEHHVAHFLQQHVEQCDQALNQLSLTGDNGLERIVRRDDVYHIGIGVLNRYGYFNHPNDNGVAPRDFTDFRNGLNQWNSIGYYLVKLCDVLEQNTTVRNQTHNPNLTPRVTRDSITRNEWHDELMCILSIKYQTENLIARGVAVHENDLPWVRY